MHNKRGLIKEGCEYVIVMHFMYFDPVLDIRLGVSSAAGGLRNGLGLCSIIIILLVSV